MQREELERIVVQVREHWAQLASRQAAMLEAVAVRCPAGCGHCCTTPVTEASVLEMLPLARDLVERGEAAAILERIAAAGKPCIMYEAHPSDPIQGRCSVYELRPTMCRLYGFAARTSTEHPGGKRYVPCVRHEELQPEAVAEAQRKLEQEGLDIPMIATEHARVMMTHRDLGRETLPINEALRRAIEFVESVHDVDLAHDEDATGASG